MITFSCEVSFRYGKETEGWPHLPEGQDLRIDTDGDGLIVIAMRDDDANYTRCKLFTPEAAMAIAWAIRCEVKQARFEAQSSKEEGANGDI